MAPAQPQVDWGTAQPIQPQVDWGSATPIGGTQSPAPPDDPIGGGKLGHALSNFGTAAADTITGAVQHPLNTLGTMAESTPLGSMVDMAIGRKTPMAKQAEGIRDDYKQNGLGPALEHVGGSLAGGMALGGVIPAIGEGASAIRSAAVEDPSVAALRGMRVGPKSPDALGVLKDVNAAKPYLQGARSLQDFQSKIPGVKNEVWAPYKGAVDAESGRTIVGPDGPTTVGELEAQRLQTSALLRKLKAGGPEAIQLATQKGMNEADLLAREKSIQGALDPHLQSVGIDPTGIRNQFGSVARLGERMSGQSTLLENKPMGFGKMANISIKQPLKAPGEILSGMRDIAAGRPLWAGSPTDVGISEAFRQGGAKPDFGQYTPRRIAGLLPEPQQVIPLSEPFARGSTRGGLFDADVHPNPPPANPEYPGIPRAIYDQGEIRPNPQFLSGSEHPEMSGRYAPAKGTVTLRGEGNPPVRYAPKGKVISPPKGPVRRFGKPKTGAP